MPRTHHAWSEEMEAFLTATYPSAPWSALVAGLPGITTRGIYQRARKLGLSRWNQGKGIVGAVAAGTATEAEIGYLAGALDGEGTLQLQRTRRHKNREREYLAPQIVIFNTDRSFVEKITRLLGGLILTDAAYERWNRPQPVHRAQLSGHHEVNVVLAALLPHLTVKRGRALLLLEFIELRRSRPSRAEYGEEEYAIWRRFYADSTRARSARPHLFEDSHANPEPMVASEEGTSV